MLQNLFGLQFCAVSIQLATLGVKVVISRIKLRMDKLFICIQITVGPSVKA